MAEPLIIDLGTLDISVGETGASKKLHYQYGWSIIPTVTGVSGNADYIFQVSHDNATWIDYKILSIDIEDGIEDKALSYLYVRIVTDGGGSSAGSCQFSMLLKK